ncbi:helix-turn-helix domain-containing protein [Yokenella regensburgei]|uniref:helix-turn-helix domain-containing protein n=1 Tax=Yokenella regensburgei TaxID=158877 RepID=UPI001375CE49|nr:helix-turn-helix transcriptional regulator [Yokenella regensburgei]KAF1370920.1 DNA-binding XRE family transcriptional regulator [Yokenella regensburgei]
MDVQYINDQNGEPQFVVIPYDMWFRMRLGQAAIAGSNDSDEWEETPYEADEYDNVGIPANIISIMDTQNVSLQAVWRIASGLSQQEVAEKLGITQSAISQLESTDSRPQKRTREKLAAIYGCTQQQISLYL